MERNTWGYHLLAFVIVAIWGSTFVFTKLLLQASLSPAHIFTLRFTIAYLLLLLNPTKFHSESWKDELLMMALGLTGGSLYFLAENAAMLYTTATNTSLIVCSCPLFAMLLMKLVYRQEESITRLQAIGSMVAFLGMAVVVLNGRFVLHLSPIGDMLALVACICWAFYSLLMKTAMKRYSTLFITRKVFFYGLLTMIPYYIWRPEFPSLDVLLSAPVFLEFRHQEARHRRCHQLGVFQPHHHHSLCLVAAQRGDHRLVSHGFGPHPHRYVYERPLCRQLILINSKCRMNKGNIRIFAIDK